MCAVDKSDEFCDWFADKWCNIKMGFVSQEFLLNMPLKCLLRVFYIKKQTMVSICYDLTFSTKLTCTCDSLRPVKSNVIGQIGIFESVDLVRML